MKALKVFLAEDHAKESFLVVRGKIVGPSWPIIGENLVQAGLDYSITEVGKTWLVVADSPATRAALQETNSRTRQTAREEVLVPEVGFVNSEIKARFEPRSLIGPAAVAVASIALAFTPALIQRPIDQESTEHAEIRCAMDLPKKQLTEWIFSSLEKSLQATSNEFALQSKLGFLRLEIRQRIGSTQSVTGSIECEDGRSKLLHYRLDTSASGALVELGQKLDP